MAGKKKSNLYDSVFAGDVQACKDILAISHAEVNRPDGMGFTPLHWAADRNFHDIAKLLLDAEADTDLPDQDGLTPLHYAAIKGSLECAQLIIPKADIDLEDYKWNKTALDLAFDSIRMSNGGFDVDRKAGCEKIADLLAQEPARRAAVAQQKALQQSTGEGISHSQPKPRI